MSEIQKYQVPATALQRIPAEIQISPKLMSLYPLAYIAVESRMARTHRVSEAIFVMLRGEALGLSPIESLESIHVIEGKPTLSAQLMLALMKRAGFRCIDESVEDEARITVYERDEDTREWVKLGTASFSMADAKAAGLAGKKNWLTYKADQLWARAVSRAARRYAPHALCGAIYTPEELGAEISPSGEVVIPAELRPTSAPLEAVVVSNVPHGTSVVEDFDAVVPTELEEEAAAAAVEATETAPESTIATPPVSGTGMLFDAPTGQPEVVYELNALIANPGKAYVTLRVDCHGGKHDGTAQEYFTADKKVISAFDAAGPGSRWHFVFGDEKKPRKVTGARPVEVA